MRPDLEAIRRGALAFDCEDCERGPCDGKPGLDPEAWCSPCIGRTLLAECDHLRGAMRAADERLARAAARVGIVAGCDAAEEMAEEIARLRPIVEAVASKNAVADSFGLVCTMCDGEERWAGGCFELDHAPSCPWLAACAYVADKGGGEGGR